MVHAYAIGMYLRKTERRNKDGSTVAYYALAENACNAQTKRAEARVVHSFGRADQLDREALRRLVGSMVGSINRVLDPDAAPTAAANPNAGPAGDPTIEIEAVFELGIVLAARSLWEEIAIGDILRRIVAKVDLSAPHETALVAMVANRLEDPTSKLGCTERWLADRAWIPEAAGLSVDQLYRAMDFLAAWADDIERDVFLKAADLFRLDVDLIFYDTTTAYFETDDADDQEEFWGGRLFAPLRRRGHNKEGRDNQPQVIIALAVSRDGMPVRSWVLPGHTADVTTVARIKEDLRAWRLGRCVFVGDAGMYSAENLAALAKGLGRYILAVPMRKLKEVGTEVLTRPGRFIPVADNLQVKEVWVGEGERRRRYVLCFNPQEAERQRQHREAVLAELEAELARLEQQEDEPPKAACKLLSSRRFGRYLAQDWCGRPRLDAAKVKAAAAYDGKFVVLTNDDTLTAEDVALGYKGAWIIESCFRRMKQTGLEVRPMFHWTARRIEAHGKLCILALQLQRAAEMRCGLPWAQIAQELTKLKAVRYCTEQRIIVQRTRIEPSLAEILKKIGASPPKEILSLSEAPASAGAPPVQA